jgi:hypothetical protein
MNDADFVYPPSFSRTDLENSLRTYRELKGSQNNTKMVKADWPFAAGLIATKNIRAGEELCRSYGLERWIIFFYVEMRDLQSLESDGLNLREAVHDLGLDLDEIITRWNVKQDVNNQYDIPASNVGSRLLYYRVSKNDDLSDLVDQDVIDEMKTNISQITNKETDVSSTG